MDSNKKDLVLELFKIGAIKFGEFKLKSGILSPIYIDLRLIISYPKFLQKIAAAFWGLAQNLKFNLMAGVPYTALPLATVISIKNNIPMVMRRKEIKDYGTRQAIEGVWQKGQRVLIIEDLVTSGSSVLETIEPLEQQGLIVQDIVVLLDREQGGRENLAKQGYHLHALVGMKEMLDLLTKEKKINRSVSSQVKKFIQENQVVK